MGKNKNVSLLGSTKRRTALEQVVVKRDDFCRYLIIPDEFHNDISFQ